MIELFNELKKGVKYSPVLAIFDPDKPNFLKNDWRLEGMGWILMHPVDDEESQKSVKLLLETGE